jgi:multidrug efflux system membrane fusion protein
MEIAIPNADYKIRSGLTAQVKIPVGEVRAHLISPALLALDTAGNIGLRTLSEDDHVVWNNITIIDDAGSGAWVTGLPDVARIITVGQELVIPGEQVEGVFEPVPTMPASSAPATTKDNAGNGNPAPANTSFQLEANAVAAS